jgi:RNA polymerase sigma-B factor
MQDSDAQLVARYQRHKDSKARELLVHRYRGMVYKLAHRYRGSSEPFEDLCQEGTIGLLRAIDLFSPDRGALFSSYAMMKIEGALRHYIRDYGRAIRLPGWVQEIHVRVRREANRAAQSTGLPPPTAELAQQLEMPLERLESLLANPALRRVSSLEELQNTDATGDEWDQDYKAVACPPREGLSPEERLDLHRALRRLNHAERKVLRLYYFQDYSFREISHAMELGYDKTRKTLSCAISKLRGGLQLSEWRGE